MRNQPLYPVFKTNRESDTVCSVSTAKVSALSLSHCGLATLIQHKHTACRLNTSSQCDTRCAEWIIGGCFTAAWCNTRQDCTLGLKYAKGHHKRFPMLGLQLLTTPSLTEKQKNSIDSSFVLENMLSARWYAHQGKQMTTQIFSSNICRASVEEALSCKNWNWNVATQLYCHSKCLVP